MNKHIILLGPPGSGKGTYASLLRDAGYNHISTGDVLRKAIENETSVGLKVKDIIEKGNLVPDDIIVELLEEYIQKQNISDFFVFDGFPRTDFQVKKLDEIIKKYLLLKDYIAINIEISRETVVTRIVNRFSCKSCGAIYNKKYMSTKVNGVCDSCGGTNFLYRTDDNKKTVENRFNVYLKSMHNILSYYKHKNILYAVDGESKLKNNYDYILNLVK